LSCTAAVSSSGEKAGFQEPSAPRPDLGDDDEVAGIRVERLPDQPVGDVRAVEIAGVDVVDAAGDGLAQHGEGGGGVPGRTEHAGAGQLHGAVAEAADGAVAQWEVGGERPG
jgi:hypothetical protein